MLLLPIRERVFLHRPSGMVIVFGFFRTDTEGEGIYSPPRPPPAEEHTQPPRLPRTECRHLLLRGRRGGRAGGVATAAATEAGAVATEAAAAARGAVAAAAATEARSIAAEG